MAGFIGANLVWKLLSSDLNVSIDNLNDYYDVSIKEYRLKQIEKAAAVHPESHWTFIKDSISDKATVVDIFNRYCPQIVINLVAQAGGGILLQIRTHIESNLIGFYNIQEACRHSYKRGQDTNGGSYLGVEHLVYASSSRVYGTNEKVPYSTEDKADNPVSLYAATKKSNELMAHAYSKLYDIPSTGLWFLQSTIQQAVRIWLTLVLPTGFKRGQDPDLQLWEL